jgi:hypothetical protein
VRFVDNHSSNSSKLTSRTAVSEESHIHSKRHIQHHQVSIFSDDQIVRIVNGLEVRKPGPRPRQPSPRPKPESIPVLDLTTRTTSLPLLGALTNPGNESQTPHTEKSGEGGLIIPREVISDEIDGDVHPVVDPIPLLPVMRSTPVVVNGQTIFPFPAPKGITAHRRPIHNPCPLSLASELLCAILTFASRHPSWRDCHSRPDAGSTCPACRQPRASPRTVRTRHLCNSTCNNDGLSSDDHDHRVRRPSIPSPMVRSHT